MYSSTILKNILSLVFQRFHTYRQFYKILARKTSNVKELLLIRTQTGENSVKQAIILYIRLRFLASLARSMKRAQYLVMDMDSRLFSIFVIWYLTLSSTSFELYRSHYTLKCFPYFFVRTSCTIVFSSRSQYAEITIIFQLCEYPCNVTHDIYLFGIQRIFLEQKLLSHGYFRT